MCTAKYGLCSQTWELLKYTLLHPHSKVEVDIFSTNCHRNPAGILRDGTHFTFNHGTGTVQDKKKNFFLFFKCS